MNFCPNCGNKLNENSNFCGICGIKIQKNTNMTNQENLSAVQSQNQNQNQNEYNISTAEKHKTEQAQFSNPSQFAQSTKKVLDSATEHLNKYTGEIGSVDINLRELFSEVFNSHSTDEAEEIFISGTKKTTPPLKQVSESWGKPWLFSRVLVWFLIAFAAFWFCIFKLNAQYAIPGFIFAGAFAMPISALIFFFELNSFKNISIMNTFKIFFVGGAFSLLIALLLYQVFPLSLESQIFGTLTVTDAFLIGLIEEVGKFIIVIYFVTKLDIKYILNGLLVGGAVGAGFAAFETAGYILSFSEQAMEVTIIRAITSIGGHLAWTAIAGGALIIVKRTSELELSHFMKSQFVFFFSSIVIMHALWDMDLPLNSYLKMAGLIIWVWIELFVIINAGLKEITKYKYNSEN